MTHPDNYCVTSDLQGLFEKRSHRPRLNAFVPVVCFSVASHILSEKSAEKEVQRWARILKLLQTCQHVPDIAAQVS